MADDDIQNQIAQIKIDLLMLRLENLRHEIQMELIKKEIKNDN